MSRRVATGFMIGFWFVTLSTGCGLTGLFGLKQHEETADPVDELPGDDKGKSKEEKTKSRQSAKAYEPRFVPNSLALTLPGSLTQAGKLRAHTLTLTQFPKPEDGGNTGGFPEPDTPEGDFAESGGPEAGAPPQVETTAGVADGVLALGQRMGQLHFELMTLELWSTALDLVLSTHPVCDDEFPNTGTCTVQPACVEPGPDVIKRLETLVGKERFEEDFTDLDLFIGELLCFESVDASKGQNGPYAFTAYARFDPDNSMQIRWSDDRKKVEVVHTFQDDLGAIDPAIPEGAKTLEHALAGPSNEVSTGLSTFVFDANSKLLTVNRTYTLQIGKRREHNEESFTIQTDDADPNAIRFDVRIDYSSPNDAWNMALKGKASEQGGHTTMQRSWNFPVAKVAVLNQPCPEGVPDGNASPDGDLVIDRYFVVAAPGKDLATLDEDQRWRSQLAEFRCFSESNGDADVTRDFWISQGGFPERFQDLTIFKVEFGEKAAPPAAITLQEPASVPTPAPGAPSPPTPGEDSAAVPPPSPQEWSFEANFFKRIEPVLGLHLANLEIGREEGAECTREKFGEHGQTLGHQFAEPVQGGCEAAVWQNPGGHGNSDFDEFAVPEEHFAVTRYGITGLTYGQLKEALAAATSETGTAPDLMHDGIQPSPHLLVLPAGMAETDFAFGKELGHCYAPFELPSDDAAPLETLFECFIHHVGDLDEVAVFAEVFDPQVGTKLVALDGARLIKLEEELSGDTPANSGSHGEEGHFQPEPPEDTAPLPPTTDDDFAPPP